MFALNTTENNAEVLNFESKTDSKKLLKDLLKVHKKLKNIARLESKIKPTVAKLNPADLEKIKSLELNYGYLLVAYDAGCKDEENKIKILHQIDLLLEKYISLFEKPQKESTNLEFNKLFEE